MRSGMKNRLPESERFSAKGYAHCGRRRLKSIEGFGA
jgi:hypothetical protein